MAEGRTLPDDELGRTQKNEDLVLTIFCTEAVTTSFEVLEESKRES
jgi:hypothetical protein